MEVNRLALNKFSLEHMKGHNDREAKAEDLSLEARLNVECDEMAKNAVRGSMTRELRHKTQELPLEKACVFIAGRKQTSDLKKRPEEANRSSTGEGLLHNQGK